MGDEVNEADGREEVAEEATPESDTQAVEQRTDDYDGVVRRLDDIEETIRRRFDAIERSLDALGVIAVEGGPVTDGDVADIAGEAAAQVIDEILGIDSLDLL